MMTSRFLVAALLVGTCFADFAAAAPPTSIVAKAKKRTVTPRNKLPPVLATLMPKHGIYMAGGGLVSSGWRVVVDFDAAADGTIYGGANPKQNAPSYGKLAGQTSKSLSKADRKRLLELAAEIWAEQPPPPPSRPNTDYGEIVIVADGDDVFFLDGYGPIRHPITAKAITELRAMVKM